MNRYIASIVKILFSCLVYNQNIKKKKKVHFLWLLYFKFYEFRNFNWKCASGALG